MGGELRVGAARRFLPAKEYFMSVTFIKDSNRTAVQTTALQPTV